MIEHINNFENLIRKYKNAGINWDDCYWPCFLLGTLPQTFSMITTVLETTNVIDMEEIEIKIKSTDFYQKNLPDLEENNSSSVMYATKII